MNSLKQPTTSEIRVPEWFTFNSSFFDEIEPLIDKAKSENVSPELISEIKEILEKLKKIHLEAESSKTTDVRREELRKNAFIQMLCLMSVGEELS